MSLRALWLAGIAASAVTPALAQQPPHIAVGYGVDTTNADVGAIVRLVREYFRLPGAGRVPTRLWNAAEQRARPDYDLTAALVFQGFPATIAGVTATTDGSGEYVIKTLFARADSGGRNIRPIAMQRLYASPRPGGWELSSALPRLTAGWSVTPAGGIVYHTPPGWKLDGTRVARATRFVDSLTHALRVDRPGRIDYYVTPSAEEMYRILGLDFFVLPSGPGTGKGGKSFPRNGIVVAGDADLGEAYFHELTHVIIGKDYPDSLQNNLVHEGIATWLGGSRGRPFAQAIGKLLEYQRAKPEVHFNDLLTGRVRSGWGNDEADAFYATGALLVDVVHLQKGIWGIKKLLTVHPPNRAVEPVLREMLDIWNQDMDAWWRNETARALRRLDVPTR